MTEDQIQLSGGAFWENPTPRDRVAYERECSYTYTLRKRKGSYITPSVRHL